jgi:hypothetical protein
VGDVALELGIAQRLTRPVRTLNLPPPDSAIPVRLSLQRDRERASEGVCHKLVFVRVDAVAVSLDHLVGAHED